jgi:transglutaminase-like putative cysteine protease
VSSPDSGEREYQVVHTTQYEYSGDVSVSYGRAHLLPRALPGQVVVSSGVVVDPGADEMRSHIDFFGNVSTYYAVRETHRDLRVTASSNVRVDRTARPVADLDQLTWESGTQRVGPDPDARAFVLASPLVRATAAVTEYAATTFTPGRPLGAALVELLERIHADFEYVSGATNIKTTLGELMHRRKGVCQDFAHLAVGCLRSHGLPARYVSGYLETDPPPGQPKLQGVDASHAWAALCLPNGDWVDIDPTNNGFVDARYVFSGWGRDYSDVPPLKGVILTQAAKSTMRVSVDVTRVG